MCVCCVSCFVLLSYFILKSIFKAGNIGDKSAITITADRGYANTTLTLWKYLLNLGVKFMSIVKSINDTTGKGRWRGIIRKMET